MLERPRKSHIRIFVFTKMRMFLEKGNSFPKRWLVDVGCVGHPCEIFRIFFSDPCTKRVQAKDTISVELPAMAVM